VILSYLELFGSARVAKLVFVDQAPLQVQQPTSELTSFSGLKKILNCKRGCLKLANSWYKCALPERSIHLTWEGGTTGIHYA
jgi:hypothetical protein